MIRAVARAYIARICADYSPFIALQSVSVRDIMKIEIYAVIDLS